MNQEAIEKLFKRYYHEAKLYVLSLCHDESLADEIVSEAFFKAFNTIDEERDGFKFWLLKVCRNAFIDHTRRIKKTAPLNDDVPSDVTDVADMLIKQEEYRALYRALSLIKDNYKEMIVLYYFEGLTVLEIASVTEQSVENVKVQMFRARAKLKQILEA